jgi:hypothetical protein
MPRPPSFRGRSAPREPGTHEHRLEKQGFGLCSWVPGSALKGRPGMTTEFFRSLLMVRTIPLTAPVETLLDCFVAPRLAMTVILTGHCERSEAIPVAAGPEPNVRLAPLGRLPSRHLCGRGTGAVKLGDDVHLIRCQLHRNGAHLLVDVVLPKPLGEGRELALDIGRLLRLQLRRAEFMVGRTVAGRRRRNPARGVPGKNETNGGIVFAKGMPGLKALADKGRQAVGAACE